MNGGIRGGLLISASLVFGGCQILFAPTEPARGDGGAGRADAAASDGGGGSTDGGGIGGDAGMCGRIGGPIFFDDFESGLGNWSTCGEDAFAISSVALCNDWALETGVAQSSAGTDRSGAAEVVFGEQLTAVYLRFYVYVELPADLKGEVSLLSFEGDGPNGVTLTMDLANGGALAIQGTNAGEDFPTSIKLPYGWQRIDMAVVLDAGAADAILLQTGGQNFAMQGLDEAISYIDRVCAGVVWTNATSEVRVRLDEFSAYDTPPP